MTVVDASVVVAALLDTGPIGAWAEALVSAESLAAPHLMPVEAANVLRRAALSGDISPTSASLAHRDLAALRFELFPYSACGGRVWELYANVTAYDAWYVALAELLGTPLATLDARLTSAVGPRCAFVQPPT